MNSIRMIVSVRSTTLKLGMMLYDTKGRFVNVVDFGRLFFYGGFKTVCFGRFIENYQNHDLMAILF